MSALIVLCAVIIAAAIAAMIRFWFIYRRGHYALWMPSYVRWSLSRSPDSIQREGPLHIILAIADHFEPGEGTEYLSRWLERYLAVVRRHRDSYGHHPRRTLHYPIEQFHDEQIEMLLPLCREGIVEIEMQLHHFDDDSDSVMEKYRKGLSEFARHGICLTAHDPPQTHFAFVHGNWALDNSAWRQKPNPCGVNDEIRMLASLGCFIDVTFPAVTTASQPRRINSIYYVTDDPDRPKSYDDGTPVEVRKPPSGDLLMLQGPLTLDWRNWRYKNHPAVENGDIWAGYPLSPQRIRLWLKANVHVIGQPNWVFVKLHAHGCRHADLEALTGASFDQTLTALETRYNDGKEYVLHYVTVREAYNIIKAAEAGMTGDPDPFRDYLIKPYLAGKR